MLIGRFQRDDKGFIGFVQTLSFQLDTVIFEKRDKGADYTIRSADCELGAAWRKSGEWGDYLSVRLDGPALLAPINATMKLEANSDGLYSLNWQRDRRGDERSDRN